MSVDENQVRYFNVDVILRSFRSTVKQLQKNKAIKKIELEYIDTLHNQQVNTINGDIQNIDYNISRQKEFFRERCINLGVHEDAIADFINSVKE